jgi:plastocyanin
MQQLAVIVSVTASLIIGGCVNGQTASNASPTSPGGASTVTVNIVTSHGTQAYTPNPAQVSVGAMMLMTNYTAEAHHVVMDDGSADFGEIAPGRSARTRLITEGGAYHCTIHPTMVGSINAPLLEGPRPCDPAFYDLSHCCDGYYC